LFSPADNRWKGADSALFLAEALNRVNAAGYQITNIDSTLILTAPKIGPHAGAIRQRVSQLTGVPADRIGIKAKTPEGIGTQNAAIAHAVVLLEPQNPPAKRKARSKRKL
jgi:2-C-methyl-D-erythritol 2,4-cyclodiphosphate synthase